MAKDPEEARRRAKVSMKLMGVLSCPRGSPAAKAAFEEAEKYASHFYSNPPPSLLDLFDQARKHAKS